MERPSQIMLAVVLLSAWLGAAVLVAGVVAPAAFAVLPTRTLAGAVVGRVLPMVFWSGMLVGTIAASVAWSLPARGWRVGAGLGLVGACVVAQLVIAPRIAALRIAMGGPVDALGADDPRRLAFGRLHGMSVLWMGLGGFAALVALVLLARTLTARSAT